MGPPRVADIVLGLDVASRTGEFAAVNSTLERMIGRRPISMRDLLAEHVNR